MILRYSHAGGGHGRFHNYTIKAVDPFSVSRRKWNSRWYAARPQNDQGFS